MSATLVNKYKTKQGGKYYTVKYQKEKIKYDRNFPIQWAMHDSFIEPNITKCKKNNPYVGSTQCGNCMMYGTFRGVFVQYCTNCVDYSNKPGCHCNLQNLVPDEFVKTSTETMKMYGYGCDRKKCIFRTYLCGVDLLTIGTNDFCD